MARPSRRAFSARGHLVRARISGVSSRGHSFSLAFLRGEFFEPSALRSAARGGAFSHLRYARPLLQRGQRSRRHFSCNTFFRGHFGRRRPYRGHHVSDFLFCFSAVWRRYFCRHGIATRRRGRGHARSERAAGARPPADARAEFRRSYGGLGSHCPWQRTVFLFSEVQRRVPRERQFQSFAHDGFQ